MSAEQQFDTVVIGAGVAGLGAAAIFDREHTRLRHVATT